MTDTTDTIPSTSKDVSTSGNTPNKLDAGVRDKPADINPVSALQKSQPRLIGARNLVLDPSSMPKIDEFNMKDCEECNQEFLRSYLYRNFSMKVCDDCRDPKGVHELITRTDAKNKYLLKDCDLDMREPPLRYVLKKNPYAKRGDMRLYLKLQVEERALEVHGSESQLEQELEKREEKRGVKKQKLYDQRMKELNKQVRSSLHKRGTVEYHEHDFDEPVCIDEDNDLYQKKCKTCDFKIEFEEM